MTDTRALIQDALHAAAQALPNVTWQPATHVVSAVSEARQGSSPDGWRFVIGRSMTGDAATPFTYDGAATRGNLVLHLTPDLARRAWESATKGGEHV